MIKVIIVDDQVIFREGIKYILEHDENIKVTGLAGSIDEAMKLCKKEIHDVVLMDIRMPGCDGIEGTKLIKDMYTNVKVIILTTFNSDDNIFQALQNGADGYILKDIKPEELILTIKSVAVGLNVIYKDAFLNVIKNGNNRSKISILNKNNTDFQMTDREESLIRLIVDGKSNKEIARDLYITEGTVRNMISTILKKLNLRDRIQLAIFAVKNDML